MAAVLTFPLLIFFPSPLQGGYSQDAVDMYTKVNMWEAAHTIAVTYDKERAEDT